MSSCKYSAVIPEQKRVGNIGDMGLFIFLAVFFGLMWYIHKYFFVRKNFLAEHVLLTSFGSAFTATVIYYVIAYVFFYR